MNSSSIVRMNFMCRLLVLLPGVCAAGTVSVLAGEKPDSGNYSAVHPSEADTTIVVDRVHVTAIKQGMALRSLPVASTIAGGPAIERDHVTALKELSQTVPNLYMPDYGSRMTSTIYLRGLGTRIDQPVIGLNVDNVPILQKNNFDAELFDADRVEVLRGPQSTLYGRNTMGGVINVYTLSPLQFEGTRLGMEYSSGQTLRLRASNYSRFSDNFGIAVSGFYTRSSGLYENEATGELCDWERSGGGRMKLQWRNGRGLQIDNTFGFSILDQGGYPYAYIGPDIERDGTRIARSGAIAYNDPCGYSRTTVSDGLTIRYDAERFSIASITGYQYSDDAMQLDNDFLPLTYFTLGQALREHSVTEDLVIRSRDNRPAAANGRYGWLFGAFGFYRSSTMEAPVTFGRQGIEDLILANVNNIPNIPIRIESVNDELLLGTDMQMPAYGGALYHESRYDIGRWHFTAGIRADLERTKLDYRSAAVFDYAVNITGVPRPIPGSAEVDLGDKLSHTYFEWLPKFSALYAFDDQRNLYVSVSKGYKAGGFNTQLFSDILQEALKSEMMSSAGGGAGGGSSEAADEAEQRDILSYKPEYSWNYEMGGHFSCMEGAVRGDFALFYIDCRDQQLTVFPEGESTGRMMTNAGKTRSWGVEYAMQYTPVRNLDLRLTYGYTNAKFVRYIDGTNDYSGNFVPYAPQHTLSVSAMKRFETGVSWLGDVVLQAGMRGTGKIYWNEENTRVQPFYAQFDASVRIEHARYAIDLWGRNLGNKGYDVFYFKSIGHEFVQRGRPRTFGITLSIYIP